ncbi:MAG: hypothetical protein GKR90_24250 [Pseudomonadales bacterium]|nr:hypothetical protein [Pseudomonadales bacterium]
MAYQLHTFSGTPFGWRVQITALVKGVPLEINWLTPAPDVLKGETFLELNPRGRVPALCHDDFVVYESTAIVEYLDALHPTPPLYGADVRQAALIRQTVAEIECYLSLNIPTFAGNLFTGQAKTAWDAIAQAAQNALIEFDHYEHVLSNNDYLVHDALSAADIMLYPLFTVFCRASTHPDATTLDIVSQLGTRYPRLTKWQTRVEAIPNFQTTIPPGYSD